MATTGIYCRPDCGANPDPANKRWFDLAAAAESAGYRACFRCRPYRTPQPVTARGPEVACRAVQMILDGALDGRTEADLAARLGVSPRHLRRLFNAHLGVTPDGLARSARAHFARRLLDDTDLAVTEIAFATGFNSVRQFNRACVEIFRASPTALRAKRRNGDRLVADGGLVLRLPFTGELDWPFLVAQLGAVAVAGVEVVDGLTYRRTVLVDGDPGVLEIFPDDGGRLRMRAHLPHWRGLVHTVARARRLASLDADVDSAHAALSGDETLRPLLERHAGVRPLGAWDPFEAGVVAIAGPAAAAQLVERWGTPVAGLAPLGLTHVFPSPFDLLDAGGVVGAFSAAVESGDVKLDRSMSLDALVAAICDTGVDARTAHLIASRLGEFDAYPCDGDARDDWRPWRAFAVAHHARDASGSGEQPTR